MNMRMKGRGVRHGRPKRRTGRCNTRFASENSEISLSVSKLVVFGEGGKEREIYQSLF